MEEIIIDGVDVTGCINYYKKDGSCMSGDCECTLCIHNDCTYKQLKRLEQENERLKEEILKWQKAYSRQYQINENKGYNKKEEQYRQTLQEIKAIAEQLLEKGLEPQSVEHQLRLKGKRELASIILDLITKAEEE